MNSRIGRIYKLWSPKTDMIYIGSTSRELHRRLNDHRSDANNRKGICYSSPLFDVGDVRIEELEVIHFTDKKTLFEFERLHYDIYVVNGFNVINKLKPSGIFSNKSRTEISSISNKTKFICDCSGRYSLSDKARHFRSKKHQNWLKTNKK